MSQSDVLNPSTTSLLNPDYTYSETLPEMRAIYQAQSGLTDARRNMVRGRTFDMVWNVRQQSVIDALRQWEMQFENGFFTFIDWERTRYYSGRFSAPLVYSPQSNDAWTVKGQFMELPGLALNTYPVNWTRDAIFIEERDDFGNDLLRQTSGVWTYAADASAHGGADYSYPNTDTTGKAEWLYCGYGCGLWAKKANNLGILNWRIIRVSDDTDMTGARAVDLYSAGTVAAAALDTFASLPLGMYRVSIEATNTKNGSSSGKTILADAIQVMR